MKNSKFKIQNFRLLFCILHFAFCLTFANAQSIDQSFPTAITTNQINGTIRARDIGDSRLTTYFYIFGGEQGDIFINVVTKNFDGDIDIFTAGGLRPLTKITVYSDNPDSETGRIIYLRQPEKLILRVQGRSPNDDEATFQIKFAGGFLAEKATTETEKTDAPQVKTENQGDVRVNSVGTIIETKPTPKPVETPAKTEETETVAEKKEEKSETVQIDERQEKPEVAEQKEETIKEEKPSETEEEKPALEVVITDNLEKPKEEKTEEEPKKEIEAKAEENKTAETPKKDTETEKTETEKETNPLERIKLVVVFKNGTKIERPMSEVLRVNVDKGILTIIHKDGSEGRYSIFDVAEMTIR